MNNAAWWIVVIPFGIANYCVLPAGVAWGWVRWVRRNESRTASDLPSLIGFTFATLSCLLDISSTLYAWAIGGFPFYDPLLMSIYQWGFMLSLAGFVFGIIGVSRPNPLRWLAPTCAMGTFIFWFVSAMGE